VRELADRYKLGVRGMPVVEPLGRFVSIHDTRRLVLVDYGGRVIASAPVPRRRSRADGVSSSVVSNGARTAVAFTATHRSRRSESVYVLEAGARRIRRLFTTNTDFTGCGYSASVEWHGRWLLYSNTEPRAVLVDTTARSAHVDLGGVIARLPGAERNGLFDIAWAPAP
jgi:hypothetical protein